MSGRQLAMSARHVAMSAFWTTKTTWRHPTSAAKKTRDGIECGSADGDARDNEVLLEKKCWRRLDWMGETTAGVLMFVPILMSTECSADDAMLATAASDTEDSAAMRC